MTFACVTELPYAFMALLVLVVFYSAYFGKMWVQKQHGIQMLKIGSEKEKNICTVEILMAIATVCVPIIQVLSIVFAWSKLPASCRFTGFLIATVGDLFFILAAFYMKDNWRAGIAKKEETELVTTGIYKYSRNPAFLGFDLQYIGVLLLYCNPLMLFFSVFAIVMLHLQILQEEQYLIQKFGQAYLEYKNQVFRYFGWRKNK